MVTAEAFKPYSGPRDPKLPDHVRKLPAKRRRQWVAVFNEVLADTDDEGRAMRAANGAVKPKKKDIMEHDDDDQAEGDKAPTKTEGGNKYEAGDYADVPDKEKPSTWKLRLAEDSSGNFTVKQISMAITALQPTGFRGQKVELGQPRATVIKKINTAIGKSDGDKEQKKALRERLTAVKALLTAAYGEKRMAEEMGEDCVEMNVPYKPWGGAQSFAEIEAVQETWELTNFIDDKTWKFRAITENIMDDDEMDAEDKVKAVAAAAAEFQKLVKAGPKEKSLEEEKGLVQRVVDGIKKPFQGDDDDEVETGFWLVRTKDGTVRWVSHSSNAFEDQDGELFATEALEKAVEYCDACGERGPLRLFHVPGADIGHCDFQQVVGRVLVESGTFADTDLGRAAKSFFLKTKEPFGVSIGYLYRPGDEEDGVYDWLRIRERSITPEGMAANPFTSFTLGGIPMGDIKEEKTAFLNRVLGEETAGKVIDLAERQTKALEAANVRYKEGDADPAPAAAAGDSTPVPTDGAPAGAQDDAPPTDGDDADDGDSKELATLVAGLKEIPALKDALSTVGTAIAALQAEVVALQATDDQKIADQMAPRKVVPSQEQRPSASRPAVDQDNVADLVKGDKGDDEPEDGLTGPAADYVRDLMGKRGAPQAAASS